MSQGPSSVLSVVKDGHRGDIAFIAIVDLSSGFMVVAVSYCCWIHCHCHVVVKKSKEEKKNTPEVSRRIVSRDPSPVPSVVKGVIEVMLNLLPLLHCCQASWWSPLIIYVGFVATIML